MDLSSFATLTIEEQQQAIVDHGNHALKAAKEDAIATSALEEAGRERDTQAQDKEPRSSDSPTTADPVLEIARNAAQEVKSSNSNRRRLPYRQASLDAI